MGFTVNGAKVLGRPKSQNEKLFFANKKCIDIIVITTGEYGVQCVPKTRRPLATIISSNLNNGFLKIFHC